MKGFFKAFLSFGVATSIEKILGFILLPIYTRYFNTIEYGIIDMISVIVSILIIFGLLQMETSLQRYYFDFQKLRKKILISNVYIWTFTFSLILTFILLVFSEKISNYFFKDNSYSYLIRIASAQIILLNLNMLSLVILRFENENLKFLKVIILKVILNLILGISFVTYFKLGMLGVISAQTISLFFTTLLSLYFTKDYLLISYNRIVTRKIFNYAIPSFPARIGSVLIVQINRFFMLSFLSLSAIGIYSVSLKLASSIQILNTAFVMAWTPIMFKMFKEKQNQLFFSNIFKVVSAGVFLIVCLITIFSKEIFIISTSEDFLEGYKYLGGLSLYFSLFIIKEVIDIGPRITKKTKYLTINFGITFLMNIFCLYFFTIYLKLQGVILAMIFTNIILIIISWYTSNKLYYINFNKSYFVLVLLPTLIISIINMYIELDLLIRIIILIFISIYYSIVIYNNKNEIIKYFKLIKK